MRTLLERWDAIEDVTLSVDLIADEIRRALAIAQAVEEFQNDMNMTDDQKCQSFIIKRADELLKVGK